MKTTNRFKQFFLFQVTAFWSLFRPKITQYILDAYRFKRDFDAKEKANKEL